MEKILESEAVAHLVSLIQEAARSSKEGVKHFVEPAPGTLSRAITKRHHIIFGRRGSGKLSLLRKGAADLTVDRRPIAYVDLEGFKGHSYPDVLLSVLISAFEEFKKWMDSAAIHPSTRKRFWDKLFGKTPSRPSYNKRDSQALSDRLAREVDQLRTELHRTDGANLTITSGGETSEATTSGVQVKGGVSRVSGQAELHKESQSSQSQQVEEKCKREKIDFLHRHILDYQDIFQCLGDLTDGDGYLFLDDLYHIRRTDQANVLDYFHRIAKDHRLWLKIGTLRHRTRWYYHGDPPIGMKISDDADEIDLDLTLEKYSLAKDFLVKIITNFANE